MFEWMSYSERAAVRFVPTLGFFALALELYAFIAARLALNGGGYIAPFSIIFFALDHTEFLMIVVAVLCGVDYFLKPTRPRAAIFCLSLVPVALTALLIIYLVLH